MCVLRVTKTVTINESINGDNVLVDVHLENIVHIKGSSSPLLEHRLFRRREITINTLVFHAVVFRIINSAGFE